MPPASGSAASPRRSPSKAARRPCLVYKVLAAGRRISTTAEIRSCFETALSSIKPTDALLIGMYQQFGDQIGENAALVSELCRKLEREG